MTPIDRELSNKLTNMSLLCAIFVILRHCGTPGAFGSAVYFINNVFCIGVGTVAVPFFFACSGYFLGRCNLLDGIQYRNVVIKRFHTLYVPFVLWNVLCLLFYDCVRICSNLVSGSSWLAEMHISLQDILSVLGLQVQIPYGPFWYMRVLCILVLISPLIMRMNRHPVWLFVPFMVSIVYPLVMTPGEDAWNVMRMVVSPCGIFYFATGLMLGGRGSNLIFRGGGMAFVGFGLLVVSAVLPMDKGQKIAVWELSVPLLLPVVWSLVPTFSLPPFVARSTSFLVYAIHGYVIFVLSAIFKAIHISTDGLHGYLTFCVMSVVLSVIAAIALTRFCPKSLSGGRS